MSEPGPRIARYATLLEAESRFRDISPEFRGILITISEESDGHFLLSAWLPDLTRLALNERLAESGVELNIHGGLNWADYDQENDEEDEDRPTNPWIIEQLGFDPKELGEEDNCSDSSDQGDATPDKE